MDEVYAVMYEFNRIDGESGKRFELSVSAGSLEEEIYRMNLLWRDDIDENISVAGIKELDKDIEMFDYLKEMGEKYGGREDGLCSLFLDEESARLLIVEGSFRDYLEFLEEE